MLILVTGATGFVGKFAARALTDAGHEVRALVRDRERAAAILGPRVELAVGSAMDQDAVRTALAGCDGLLHAAAVYSYDRRDVARVSADTPALADSVLGAALECAVPRVVDVASAVVFTTRTDLVDLSTRLAAPGDPTWSDAYVRAKVAAERAGTELAGRGLRRTVLYPTRVLGPEDAGPGTSGASLIALLNGRVTTNARGGWVDVRDLATAIVAAFNAPTGTRAIVSSSSMRYRELGRLLERVTGRRHRRWFMRSPTLRLMARLNDRADGRLFDLPRAEALEYILTSPPIDGSSAVKGLGVTYRPLEDTITDAIRWWAANGTIDRIHAGRLAARSQ